MRLPCLAAAALTLVAAALPCALGEPVPAPAAGGRARSAPLASAAGVDAGERLAAVPSASPKVERGAEQAARQSSVTISPTPLLGAGGLGATWGKGSVFVLEPPEAGAEFLPNVALNKTCVVSSSPSREGTFCRLSGAGGQLVQTVAEEDPFVLFDLGRLHFVDHLSFSTPPALNELERAHEASPRLLVQCLNATHPGMARTEDGRALPSGWSKVALLDSYYSFHVHAACRVLRMQRLGFGNLAVQDLKVLGAPVVNAEVLTCLSHSGALCGDAGSCDARGRCVCRFGFSGEHCDVQLAPVALLLLGAALALCAALALLLARRSSSKAAAPDELRRGLLMPDYYSGGAGSSLSELAVMRAAPMLRSQSQPAPFCEPDAAGPCSSSSSSSNTCTSSGTRGSLHLLFSSPLVMAVPESGELRAIQALDIKREYELLRQSLSHGSKRRGPALSVSAATIDQLHRLMTVGAVRCLHFSGHCTAEFVAFEDGKGGLHQLKMPALRALLRSTVTPRSLCDLRMVVLSACNSEAAALEFMLAGVPHVVAYRGRVRDATAQAFTQALYLALSCGRTVRDAFESAKEAVRSSPDGCRAAAAEMDAFVLVPERADHAEALWPQSGAGKEGELEQPAEGGGELLQNQAPQPRWPDCEGMRQLPPSGDELIGRHVELFKVLNALSASHNRAVFITGPSGRGKSHIARAASHHLHLRRSAQVFPDGVLFVKNGDASHSASASHGASHSASALVQLAHLLQQLVRAAQPLLAHKHVGQQLLRLDGRHDAAELAAAAAAGDEAALRRAVAREADLLADALAEQRCLIVLDGVEETPVLVELLLRRLLEEAPHIKLLVTCNNAYALPLECGRAAVELPSLSPKDSTLLLAKNLKRRVLHTDGRDMTLQDLAQHRIVKETEGNPYAIIKAALDLAKTASGGTIVLETETTH